MVTVPHVGRQADAALVPPGPTPRRVIGPPEGELGRCVELVDPSRLMLFVPDAARNHPACRTMFAGLLPAGLPPHPTTTGAHGVRRRRVRRTWHADIGVAQAHDLVNTIHGRLDG